MKEFRVAYVNNFVGKELEYERMKFEKVIMYEAERYIERKEKERRAKERLEVLKRIDPIAKVVVTKRSHQELLEDSNEEEVEKLEVPVTTIDHNRLIIITTNS
jgi:hypothetical protein